jgi:hypothetical protein
LPGCAAAEELAVGPPSRSSHTCAGEQERSSRNRPPQLGRPCISRRSSSIRRRGGRSGRGGRWAVEQRRVAAASHRRGAPRAPTLEQGRAAMSWCYPSTSHTHRIHMAASDGSEPGRCARRSAPLLRAPATPLAPVPHRRLARGGLPTTATGSPMSSMRRMSVVPLLRPTSARAGEGGGARRGSEQGRANDREPLHLPVAEDDEHGMVPKTMRQLEMPSPSPDSPPPDSPRAQASRGRAAAPLPRLVGPPLPPSCAATMAHGEGKPVGREEQAQGKSCRAGRRCDGVPVDDWRLAPVAGADAP